MKVLRFIFSLYILSLSVFPCSDQEVCVDERKMNITVAETADHDHSSDEQDACTPFCICSCCAASIQLITITAIDFTPYVHNTPLNTTYIEKPLADNTSSIWQPPRIS